MSLSDKWITLLWPPPPGCTDEVQPIDAGYGRLLKLYCGRQELDAWLKHGENLQKWEINRVTAFVRRVLLKRIVGNTVQRVDPMPDYRRNWFEKPAMVVTADGALDECIHLEGLSGPYTFEHTVGSDDENGDGDERGHQEKDDPSAGSSDEDTDNRLERVYVSIELAARSWNLKNSAFFFMRYYRLGL